MGRSRKSYRSKALAELMETIGRKVTVYREEAGLSQNALSRKAGVALSTLNEIENGVREDLRLSTITALAEPLGRSPIEFFTSSDLVLSDSDKKDLELIHGRINRLFRKLV